MAARIIVVLLCAAALVAAEVEIRIRPTTTLATARAMLGDVAELSGDEAACARLRAVVVAELSTLTPVQVDARLLTALATRTAAPAVLSISGAGTVSRRAHTFTDADLLAAAAATVSGARTVPVRCSGAITVPEGAILLAEPLDPKAVGEVPFRVRALEDGRETGRSLVVLRVERDVQVVVAARNLVHGEVIGPNDLRSELRVATRANLQAVIDPASLVGSILRRDLAAGEPVLTSMVAVRPAVRAGSAVTVYWSGNGFSVELQGIALADARAGERVGVRRSVDKAVFTCVAQADGTVLVQP